MNVPHPSPNSVVSVTNEDPVLNAKAVKFVCFLFQHCLESQRGKENWGGGGGISQCTLDGMGKTDTEDQGQGGTEGRVTTVVGRTMHVDQYSCSLLMWREVY